MFKWFGSSNDNQAFVEPHCINIASVFDLLYDEAEFPNEKAQKEHQGKVVQWMKDKYSSQFDQILCVNFSKVAFEVGIPKINNIEYGMSTYFHFEQLVNMLQLSCTLHSILESYEASCNCATEDSKFQFQVDGEVKTEQQQLSSEKDSLPIQDESTTEGNTLKPIIIVFYCTSESLYYALLLSSCLIEFTNGVACLETYLKLTNDEVIEQLIMKRTSMLKHTYATISTIENTSPSLMRYSKFFNILIQLPMPYITVYTLEKISFNSLISPHLTHHFSSIQDTLSETVGRDGKLYFVVTQNDREVYSGFFQQQSGSISSNFLLNSGQSASVTETATGERWYNYEVSKPNAQIFLLGDFVLCCYWVFRDQFTKVFRYTFNTMFLRHENDRSKHLDLVVHRSDLDWVENVIVTKNMSPSNTTFSSTIPSIPKNFVMKISLKEKHSNTKGDDGNSSAFPIIQNYRMELEKYLLRCPFYYLNSGTKKVLFRLYHVKSSDHLLGMKSVNEEYKSIINSDSGFQLKPVPEEERFDAKYKSPSYKFLQFGVQWKSKDKIKSAAAQKFIEQQRMENGAIDLGKFESPKKMSSNNAADNSTGIEVDPNAPLPPPLPPFTSTNSAPCPPPPPPLFITSSGLPPPPPPPPPSFGGSPPLPPPGPQFTTSKPAVKVNMKRLDWAPIRDVTSQSVWSELSTPDDSFIHDIDEFKDIFSQKQSAPVLQKKVVASDEISVLPSNLNRNMGIVFASQFRNIEDPTNLVTMVTRFGSLDLAQLTNLHQFVTSINREQRAKLLAAGRNSYSKLPKTEQWLWHLIRKDRIQQQIETMMYMHMMPETFQRLLEKLQLKISSCEVVKNSEGFKKILHYVLIIGKVMNEGRGNLSNVSGFKLDILPKLEDTKANTKDAAAKSLMHYLAKMVKEKDEAILRFFEGNFEDLVSKSAKSSLNSLIPLQKQFEFQTLHIQNEFKYYSCNQRDIDDKSLEKLKELCETASSQFEYLSNISDICETVYSETLEYFHYERDSAGESDSFFSIILDFITKFKRACEENDKREEQERKQKGKRRN